MVETQTINTLLSGTLTIATWVSLVVILTAVGAAAWLVMRNLFKYNIKIVLFRKASDGWHVFFDRAAVVSRKGEGEKGEKVSTLRLLREKVEMPTSILEHASYTQGFMHLVRVLILRHVSGTIDYKPMAVKESSDPALNTIDFDTWQWLVDGVAADYQEYLKPRGMAAFLQTYGPYVAFGMFFVMIFALGMIMMGDIKAVASGLQAAAEAGRAAGTASIPAAP